VNLSYDNAVGGNEISIIIEKNHLKYKT